MDPFIESRFRESGEKLRNKHDSETIRATIEAAEALDSETGQISANILRTMADIGE